MILTKCYIGHIVSICVAIPCTEFMVYLAKHSALIPICMLTVSFRTYLTHKELNYVDQVYALKKSVGILYLI